MRDDRIVTGDRPNLSDFNATVEVEPFMTAEDLRRAGLDSLGREWAQLQRTIGVVMIQSSEFRQGCQRRFSLDRSTPRREPEPPGNLPRKRGARLLPA